MFSSNDTPPQDFKYARELGSIINLDDITHIDFLEKVTGGIPETICCRYNPGGLFQLSNGIMDNPGDAKYGMTTEQILEAYKILKSKGAKRNTSSPIDTRCRDVASKISPLTSRTTTLPGNRRTFGLT